jgi:hypothetical protein
MLSLRGVWVLLTLVGAFIGPASSPLGLEAWSMLALGRWIVDHRGLPDAEPLTSAPPSSETFVDQQWLVQVVAFAVQSLGGLESLILVTALAIALAYCLLLAASFTASGRLRLACLSVWLAYALGASNLTARPQTLAYPLCALFVLAVTRVEWRKDGSLLRALPVAMAVWVNVHGSFVLGLLVLGCALAGSRLTKGYALTLAACALATLVNPYGLGAWRYALDIGVNPIIRQFVTEWAPTSLASSEGVLFFASVAGLLLLTVRSKTRLTRTEMCMLVAFGVLALTAVRSVVWFGFVSAPIVARLLGGLAIGAPAIRPERPRLNAAIAAVLAGVALVSLPWTKAMLPFLPADKAGLVTWDTPVRATEYLARQPPEQGARLLNYQVWGGYLAWSGLPPFVDGRFEVHPAAVWLDYLAMTYPRADWPELFERYDIQYALLSRTQQPDLEAALRQAPRWRVAYADDRSIVFAHQADV